MQHTHQMVGSDDRAIPNFEIEVHLDGLDPYRATARQAVPQEALFWIERGPTEVTVYVDRSVTSRIAIDFWTPPAVTGVPRYAEPAELDIYSFIYNGFVDGKRSYQVDVGNPLPSDALPLMYPGSRVPVKVSPGDPLRPHALLAAARPQTYSAKPVVRSPGSRPPTRYYRACRVRQDGRASRRRDCPQARRPRPSEAGAEAVRLGLIRPR
jgi:hypothetical protein